MSLAIAPDDWARSDRPTAIHPDGAVVVDIVEPAHTLHYLKASGGQRVETNEKAIAEWDASMCNGIS
jgi:hypothetical protein